MRVGIIIYGDIHTVSGGFLYDRQLVSYLRSKGDEVEVISLPWQKYWRCLAHNALPSLVRRITNGSWDVLLQDELCHPSLFLLNRTTRKRFSFPLISLVYHLRSCEDGRPRSRRFFQEIERRYFSFVDGYVCCSNAVRYSVEMLLKERAMPCVVAFPGRDEAVVHYRQRSILPGDEFGVLFLGNVIRRKGLLELVQALSRMPEIPWKLSVTGNHLLERGYTEAVRQCLRRTHLLERAVFHGYLSNGELEKVFVRTHVLAMPSWYEGFGIAYLEALARGIPVIASSGGGARELITHGQEGFLVAPGSISALADALKTLYNNKRRQRAMGWNARLRYLRHPAWPESMEKVRQFLLTMVRYKGVEKP